MHLAGDPLLRGGQQGLDVPTYRVEVVAFVQKLREGDYFKLPGVAETIDWAAALAALNARELEPAVVDETLGVLLKYQDDIQRLQGTEAAEILQKVKADIAASPLG